MSSREDGAPKEVETQPRNPTVRFLPAWRYGGARLPRTMLLRLKRNCVVEKALGLAILIVVGAL